MSLQFFSNTLIRVLYIFFAHTVFSVLDTAGDQNEGWYKRCKEGVDHHHHHHEGLKGRYNGGGEVYG